MIGRSVNAAHTPCRKRQREGRAHAGLAANVELTTMALNHMLDDRQPESGSAGVARAAAVNAIEALGQPRQVFVRDAYAGIGDRQRAGAIGQQTPGHFHAAAVGGVAHRVVDQVGDGAGQFALASGQLRREVAVEVDLMPACRQGRRVGLRLRQQWRDREPTVAGRARAAFQRRQRQQVADQRLHPRRPAAPSSPACGAARCRSAAGRPSSR